MVEFHRKAAGLICMSMGDRLHFHLVVRRGYRIWGIRRDWYDGPTCYLGAGPLFLVCW